MGSHDTKLVAHKTLITPNSTQLFSLLFNNLIVTQLKEFKEKPSDLFVAKFSPSTALRNLGRETLAVSCKTDRWCFFHTIVNGNCSIKFESYLSFRNSSTTRYSNRLNVMSFYSRKHFYAVSFLIQLNLGVRDLDQPIHSNWMHLLTKSNQLPLCCNT